MTLISFGYDMPLGHQRGLQRSDRCWPYAVEDCRGFGWQVIWSVYGNRSRHVTRDQAIEMLSRV